MGFVVVPFQPEEVHVPAMKKQPVREIETAVACAFGRVGRRFGAEGWIPTATETTSTSAMTRRASLNIKIYYVYRKIIILSGITAVNIDLNPETRVHFTFPDAAFGV